MGVQDIEYARLVGLYRDADIAFKRKDTRLRVKLGGEIAQIRHKMIKQSGNLEAHRFNNLALSQGSYLSKLEEPQKPQPK